MKKLEDYLYAHRLKDSDNVWFLSRDKKPNKEGLYMIVCPNCFKNPKKKLCESKLDPRKVVEKIGFPVKWLICGHECWK